MSEVLYLMPVIVASVGDRTVRRPKYLTTNYQMADFGYEGDCIVGATVTPTEDVDISAMPDVVRLPDNLDAQIGGALNVVQSGLESRHIPAGWVDPGMTFRFVLRKVCAISEFFQSVCGGVGLYQPLIGGGINLNTQFSDLPLNARQRLQFAADRLPTDRTGFSGATTIRQLLKSVADQLDKPRTFRNITV